MVTTFERFGLETSAFFVVNGATEALALAHRNKVVQQSLIITTIVSGHIIFLGALVLQNKNSLL
jgi:hypothetical protein